MKYAILILVICGCMCGCLAYRLGRSDCRANRAEIQLENNKKTITNDREIQQMVMSISDSDNLLWLLNEWKRGE